jgi:hypothetical protein
MTDSTVASGARFRVARSRGMLSGLLLVLLGAWAGLVPFIGPYFDFAFTPSPEDAWAWTAERGYMEVAPAAAAILGGLILLFTASRVMAIAGAWLGIAGGTWLIIGPPLSGYLNIDIGQPDPASDLRVRTLEMLFFFSAIGAAILFVASLALGRMSTHSVRDVRAAERRAADLAAAREREAIAAAETAPAAESAGPTIDESEPTADANQREGRADTNWTAPTTAGGPEWRGTYDREDPAARRDQDVPRPVQRSDS